MSVPPGILDELYGLAPRDFTAARDARAKELRSAGDRDAAAAAKRLARPSAAAWAVNRLVRRDPARVYEVLELGEDLRRAQARLDGGRLRELSRRRAAVVNAAVRVAADLARDAGQPLSGPVTRQVEATLHAAMADPDAAARVRAGRLTEALEPAGFALGGGAGGDPSVTAPDPARASPEEGAADGGAEESGDAGTEAVRAVIESARRRARQTQEAADRAREGLADAERRLDGALDDHRGAEERVRGLRRELRQAEQHVSATQRAAESAGRERDEAARTADRAGRALDASRRRLQALGLPAADAS